MKYKNDIKKSELLIYIFIGLITFCKGIGLPASNKLYIIAYISGSILALIKMFMEKYSRREMYIILSIVCIGILDFLLGKTSTVLFSAIVISCLKNIDLKKVFKVMFSVRLIAFIIMIILPYLGIIDNNVIYFYRDGQTINRYSFGFSHPNLAHSSFSLIILLWGYINFYKINFAKIFGIEICNFALYKYTCSRTGFLILTIYLLFIYIMKKSNKLFNLLPKILNISFIMCIIISFILAIGYTKVPFIAQLDIVFTGRIRYMSMLLKYYSFPIIGKAHYQSILIDNGYFSLIYEGGLLATIWFLLITFKNNKYLINHKKYNEMILLIFLWFYCISESYYMNILMNPSLFFLTYFIFEKQDSENIKEIFDNKNNMQRIDNG